MRAPETMALYMLVSKCQPLQHMAYAESGMKAAYVIIGAVLCM